MGGGALEWGTSLTGAWFLPDVMLKCEKVLYLDASEKGQPTPARRWGAVCVDHPCLGNEESDLLRDPCSFWWSKCVQRRPPSPGSDSPQAWKGLPLSSKGEFGAKS